MFAHNSTPTTKKQTPKKTQNPQNPQNKRIQNCYKILFPTKMRHAEKEESVIHTQEKKNSVEIDSRRPRMLDLVKKTLKSKYKYVQIIKGNFPKK